MSFTRAFIFDLDGVITDTAHLHFLSWRKLAQSIGLDFDEAFNERLKGVSRMDSLELILAQSPRTYSMAEKQALATQKNADYVKLIDTVTPNDLLPGARAALKKARAAGCGVALASASKNAFAVLDRLGITDLFDHVVDANFVAQSKPHPEVFLKAAEALACEPSLCIGVEDAVAGVQAIKSAGMYALGIGDPVVLAQADRVMPNLLAFDPQVFLQPQVVH